MEGVAPARWVREEGTFELSLEEGVQLVISHKEMACLGTGTVDSVFCLPSPHPPSLWASAP